MEVPVNVRRLGTTGGDSLRVNGSEISLEKLRRVHEGFFPKLMGKELHVA
jgi:hypothetical protein